MAKLTLENTLSGYRSNTVVNANNDKIEDALNNRVLYRDNPTGEPNQMESNLDMNSKRILNLPVPVSASEPVLNSQLAELASADTGNATNIVYVNPEGGSEQVDNVLDDLQSRRNTYEAEVGLSDIGTLDLTNYTHAKFPFYHSAEIGGGGELYKLDVSDVREAFTDSAGNKWRFLEDGPFLAEMFGAYGDGVEDDLLAMNKALDMYGSVQLKPGATYGISSTLYIDEEQEIYCESAGNRAIIKVLDTEFRGSAIESVDFGLKSCLRIKIKNIYVDGVLESLTVAEVAAFTGAEGQGLRLTCGIADLDVVARYMPGVGIFLSDGGDSSLYTHVNELHLVSAFTGQEGIIFEGGLDQRIKYCEAYFAWDSQRDTDYTTTKVSKAVTAAICAGVLFRRGSCEVVEMHPSNNRHGYAWATFGESGAAYRMRFAHAIGEGSAGGCYLAPTDDVTGGLLNVHSTRGKYGLPLARIRSLNNVNIGQLDVKVDQQAGYPEADGGTYRAVDIDGDRCVINNMRIWATTGKIQDTALAIKGANHKIKGDIWNIGTKEDGTDAIAATFLFPLTDSNIDLNFTACGTCISGASGNTDIGVLNATFSGVTTDITPTYLGFITDECLRRGYLYNFDNGRTNKSMVLGTGIIPAANADGTTRTVNIDITDKFYQAPMVSGLTVSNRGSSSYNASGINMWVAGTTSTALIVKYNIASYSGDFEITAGLV